MRKKGEQAFKKMAPKGVRIADEFARREVSAHPLGEEDFEGVVVESVIGFER